MKSLFQETSLSVDQAFVGRVFQVEVQTVALQDGRSARREIVRHSGGACVLALDNRLGVAMVRQFRKPFDRVLLEIPAGKLEPGEDPLECARRELSEETGFSARNLSLLTTLYPSPGYCSEVLSVYLATGLTAGQSHLDEGEHLSCQVYPLADLLDLVDCGEIRDAKTIAALLLVSRRLASDSGLLDDLGER